MIYNRLDPKKFEYKSPGQFLSEDSTYYAAATFPAQHFG